MFRQSGNGWGISLGVDQGTGLGGKLSYLEFAGILNIGIGGVNNRCLQLPRSSSIIGDLRPESTLRQTDLFFRHTLTTVGLAALSIIQA